ncbi:MAG: DUF748 domain-containing protein [Halioglobus sp.]
MRSTLRGLAIAYGIYLALTLLIVTPALNLLPAKYVHDNYGRELQTEWVVLNPFKLSLDLKSLALSEPDGSPFFALGESSVNLSLSSLWHSGVVFDEIRAHDIAAHIVHLGDGQFNFSDLIPAQSEEPVEVEEAEPMGVTIRQLDVRASELVLEDRDREEPFQSRWNDLNIVAQELSTVHTEGKPYKFALRGPEGGELTWSGDVSLAAGNSRGRLTITDLSLANLGQAGQPWLPLHLAKGRLGVAGDYEIDWSSELRYSIGAGTLSVSDLELLPYDQQALSDTGITLTAFNVDDIRVSSEQQRADVGAVTINGFAANGWMEDERISLLEMLTGPAAAEEEKTPAETASEDAGWSAAIASINIDGSAVNFRSEFTEPGLLQISPITASVKNLNWPLQGASPVQLAVTLNEQAELTLDGSISLDSGSGDLNYSLQNLALPWFNPNLPTALKAMITDGAVAVKGNASLQEFAPTTIALDGAITDFAVQLQQELEQGAGEETIRNGWKSVRIAGLAVNTVDRSIALKRIAIDDLVGRVHIFADGSVNALSAWEEESPTDDAPAEEVSAAEDEQPWSIDVPEITLTDSQIDFMDQSLPIHFRTVIGQLDGKILGLGSSVESNATVDIKGSVDNYSPVTLAGTVAPLREPPALDLDLKFKGLDMALLSPYSATYAGRNIERGLLDLELGYELEENRLKGDNRIRMDQLKLGEKIKSDQAVDLPLDLAVAVMTDSSGVIDMKVPVSGNVDDPSFSLGSVIGTALVGLIREVVTAPFKLLANLVGSDADFQHINFAEGAAQLDAAGVEKITSLSTALAQRPKLKLVILGSVDAETDRSRLQKNALAAELIEDGLTEADVSSKDERWERAIDKRFDDLPATGEDAATLTIRDKYLRVAEAITISDEQLLALATQRAVAVKTAFVEQGGIEAERAVVGQPSLDQDDSRCGGVTLEIN